LASKINQLCAGQIPRGRNVMDTEKAEEKAIQKRVKSRRYGGKYKGRGKYKPKDPA
jgi:hypothetical protein